MDEGKAQEFEVYYEKEVAASESQSDLHHTEVSDTSDNLPSDNPQNSIDPDKYPPGVKYILGNECCERFKFMFKSFFFTFLNGAN